MLSTPHLIIREAALLCFPVTRSRAPLQAWVRGVAVLADASMGQPQWQTNELARVLHKRVCTSVWHTGAQCVQGRTTMTHISSADLGAPWHKRVIGCPTAEQPEDFAASALKQTHFDQRTRDASMSLNRVGGTYNVVLSNHGLIP